jgi:hypothetical protein
MELCDRCTGHAVVRVLIPGHSDILLCGHHARKSENVILRYGFRYIPGQTYFQPAGSIAMLGTV